MTTTAQYATLPKNGVSQISVANTNRDGTGTLGVILTASSKSGGGTRVDALAIQAIATTTAGMVRLFLQKGRPGPLVVSSTFTGTTAVVTTDLNHGLTTGQTVTMQGAAPDEYNVVDAAITVTGAKSFTYVMGVAPVSDAQVQGNYCSSLAVPVRALLREVAVTAAVPSGTVLAFSSVMQTGNATDKGYFPLILQPGWSLRAATHNAEIFNIIPTLAGDFA